MLYFPLNATKNNKCAPFFISNMIIDINCVMLLFMYK